MSVDISDEDEAEMVKRVLGEFSAPDYEEEIEIATTEPHQLVPTSSTWHAAQARQLHQRPPHPTNRKSRYFNTSS